MPPTLPPTRCALTAPFHPYRLSAMNIAAGGLLSVALSLGSPPPDVIRRRVRVEPGLSSARKATAVRPTGGKGIGAAGRRVKRRVLARASLLSPAKSLWPGGKPIAIYPQSTRLNGSGLNTGRESRLLVFCAWPRRSLSPSRLRRDRRLLKPTIWRWPSARRRRLSRLSPTEVAAASSSVQHTNNAIDHAMMAQKAKPNKHIKAAIAICARAKGSPTAPILWRASILRRGAKQTQKALKELQAAQ